MGLLDVSVITGESGPVLVLSGEADLTAAAELGAALDSQIGGGARHLTVDVSGLRFADSAAIAALVLAARALKERGGVLELLGPQEIVARALSLLGADQVLDVQAGTGADGPQAHPGLGGQAPGRAGLTGPGPWPYQPGHGLWLVRQVAAQISVLAGAAGSRVTVTFALPAAQAPA